MNVFATPGEVFDEVKSAPVSVLNWLVPAFLFAVVGAISVVIVFSQPNIQQQMREKMHEQQAKAIQEKVKAGKISQADADKALALMDRFVGPTILKISGAVGAVFAAFIQVLWWAFILWLLGRWCFKTQVGYGKSMEVAGLAVMISILGSIVSLLLTVSLDRVGAGPNLALVVKDFDLTRKSHLFMGAANLFSFWMVAVISSGLARLVGVPWVRAALPVFAYWFLKEALLISIGLGQLAL